MLIVARIITICFELLSLPLELKEDKHIKWKSEAVMEAYYEKIILEASRANKIVGRELIQNLWSGYGEIVRYKLEGSAHNSVVVKNVCLPKKAKHPRGWNTDLSHRRKVKSYEVEMNWYRFWGKYCDKSSRIPDCLAMESRGDEVLMVLEDLDDAGYSLRKDSIGMADIKKCLTWLANFHVTFLGVEADNLWKIGTYWHLETRPEELEILSDSELKKTAHLIDEQLNNSDFQTFVHGDAKLANFCFSEDGKDVAAVDFQYVGGGCGMKDVAYFIGSCLFGEDCEKFQDELLDYYFEKLEMAISIQGKQIDYKALESDWRKLYPVAWTDFHRFIKGWSTTHWKINSYSERLARNVIKQLLKENNYETK